MLPASDKQALGISRLTIDDAEYEDDQSEDDTYFDQKDTYESVSEIPSARRVDIVPSLYLNLYYNQHPVCVTLDTGATNTVRTSLANAICIPIRPPTQSARQADGITPLKVVGEIHCTFSRSGSSYDLDALVVDNLDVGILTGNPFLHKNDIVIRVATCEITVAGVHTFKYLAQAKHSIS